MSRFENIKEFMAKHQDKIIMTIGFILTTAISFAIGRLSTSNNSEPIEVKDPSIEIASANNQEIIPQFKSEGSFVGDINNNEFYPINSIEAGNIADDNKIWFDSLEDAEEQDYIQGKSTTTESNQNLTESNNNDDINISGKYVGSKNSDKYHLPDSGSAKRIKDENKIWFQSKEDAESQGYEAGSSVKKSEN